MRIFDWIMRAPDSYWKRQFKAEEIKRKSAEADLEYWRGTCQNQQEELSRISERALLQARAIDKMAEESDKLKDGFSKYAGKLEENIQAKDKEIVMLHEALRTERELSAALRTNSRLWENLKAEKLGSSGECVRDPV